jgi:hypothetical protein
MKIPAWQGNWEKRIYDRVFQRDFPTLTALADSRPTATLKELARDLGPEKDIAPIQVEWLLRHEAEQSRMFHRFARSVLVREIHAFFPQGWNRATRPAPGPSPPDEWCRAGIWADWVIGLGESHKTAAKRVWHSLERTAAVGWLPSGPDDPIIVQAFREGGFPEDGDATETGETNGPA